MSDYYPPGSANDPKAPWNQNEPKFEDCPDCDGYGFSYHDCGEDSCCCLNPLPNVPCETCGGEGEIESDDSDDEYEEEFF